MRQRDCLTIEEARELDALERALAGEPVDADLLELEGLVLDIRATAPEMTPGFAARLERDVEEGFVASQEQPARRQRRRLLVLLPAAGTLAAALVALVVVLGNRTTDTDTLAIDTSGGGAQRESASPASGSAKADSVAPQGPQIARSPVPSAASGVTSTADRAAAAPAAAAPAPSALKQQSVAPTTRARKVQRSADLTLSVPMRKLDSAADGVIRTVDRFGGIVASSAIGSDDNTGEASFDVRIPTERLDEALAALSKLGHVAERRQNLVDITGSFTSAEDRLSDARAERRGLLKALGAASTQQSIDSLKARLRNVRSQIARLNGDLEALRRRADLSRVSVTVRGDGDGAASSDGGDGDGRWSPGDAARDAVRVLEVIAGVALIALAIAVPLGLLAGLVAVGVRSARRRRREGVLDPA